METKLVRTELFAYYLKLEVDRFAISGNNFVYVCKNAMSKFSQV